MIIILCQYSWQCFCGDTYDRHGPLNEGSCNAQCSGNRSEICGGDFAISVYSGELFTRVSRFDSNAFPYFESVLLITVDCIDYTAVIGHRFISSMLQPMFNKHTV